MRPIDHFHKATAILRNLGRRRTDRPTPHTAPPIRPERIVPPRPQPTPKLVLDSEDEPIITVTHEEPRDSSVIIAEDHGTPLPTLWLLAKSAKTYFLGLSLNNNLSLVAIYDKVLVLP